MSNNPLVSVIIPSKNRASFLIPTIESILNQNYPNIECIVIDGCSTDNSIEILTKFQNKLTWISEKDNGQADAINKGILMSKGDIITWLNADDLWNTPDTIDEIVNYFRCHPDADVVYGQCGAIDINGKNIGVSYCHKWDLAYAIEFSDHCIPQPSAFIRRKIFDEVGLLDTPLILFDIDLWFRIGLIGKILYVPKLFSYARKHSSYWYPKSDIVANNCITIIKKVYNRQNLPKEILKIKKRAFSNAYIKGAEYAMIGNKKKKILIFLLTAILIDPSNVAHLFLKITNVLKKSMRAHYE